MDSEVVNWLIQVFSQKALGLLILTGIDELWIGISYLRGDRYPMHKGTFLNVLVFAIIVNGISETLFVVKVCNILIIEVLFACCVIFHYWITLFVFFFLTFVSFPVT